MPSRFNLGCLPIFFWAAMIAYTYNKHRSEKLVHNFIQFSGAREIQIHTGFAVPYNIFLCLYIQELQQYLPSTDTQTHEIPEIPAIFDAGLTAGKHQMPTANVDIPVVTVEQLPQMWEAPTTSVQAPSTNDTSDDVVIANFLVPVKVDWSQDVVWADDTSETCTQNTQVVSELSN